MMSSRVAPTSSVIQAGAGRGCWPGMHPMAAATSTRSRTSTVPQGASSRAAGFLIVGSQDHRAWAAVAWLESEVNRGQLRWMFFCDENAVRNDSTAVLIP